MKKLLAVLVVLTLALAAGCAAAEERTAEEIMAERDTWVADSLVKQDWVCDRASLEIVAVESDDLSLEVRISWADSAFENNEWVYYCYYDVETQIVCAEKVIYDKVAYPDEGGEIRTNVYERNCEADFDLGEDGRLTIHDPDEPALDLLAFEKLELPEEKGEPLTEEEISFFKGAVKDQAGFEEYEPLRVLGREENLLIVFCKGVPLTPEASDIQYAVVYLEDLGSEVELSALMLTDDGSDG